MGTLPVRVVRKWRTSCDVAAFALAPIDGSLPPFSAGAHIDVHVPGGAVRQYSLTNGPGERDAYVIGVKREARSRGGSQAMHDRVQAGDTLTIAGPRNTFGLAPAARASLLVAGGIGVTPLLAMARQLHRAGAPFALHCFARSAEHLAFSEALDALGPSVTRHFALDNAATLATVRQLLAGRRDGEHLYACGPGPMLEAAIAAARGLGWPDDAVHCEYFSNDRAAAAADGSFTVVLARRGLTVTVPADQSLLETLRGHGVAVDSSCEQGVCGTCFTKVLDGVPDHRDVFLTGQERDSGACMMLCVSRAKSAVLVLDL